MKVMLAHHYKKKWGFVKGRTGGTRKRATFFYRDYEGRESFSFSQIEKRFGEWVYVRKALSRARLSKILKCTPPRARDSRVVN
jgi:hypothetical protein